MDRSTISNTILPIDNILGYKIAISEMQYRLEEQYRSINAFKSTTQQIFATASLVVGLGGSLQLFNVYVSESYYVLYNWLILIAVGFYLLLILTCITALFPVKVKGPTPSDNEQLYIRFIWRTDEKDILRQQLDNYVAAINANEPIIQKRRRLAIITTVLLPIIVVIFFILSIIPRTPIT